MADTTTHVIAIIAEELACNHMRRPAPVVTADTLFADTSMDAIDLVCIAIALSEAYGREFGDAEIEGWAGVADVVRSVERVTDGLR